MQQSAPRVQRFSSLRTFRRLLTHARIVTSALLLLLCSTSAFVLWRRRGPQLPAHWAALCEGSQSGRSECGDWTRTCGVGWDTAAIGASHGDLSCFGSSENGSLYCVVPSLCVSAEHGAWVEARPTAAILTAGESTTLPPVMTHGLGPTQNLYRLTLPIRDTASLLGTHPDAVARPGVPAVVMSTYECQHWSHFLYNTVYPAFGGWLRLGAHRDTALILVNRHGTCAFPEVLAALFGNVRVDPPATVAAGDGTARRLPFMSLDARETLPTVATCYSPALIGSRGACLHSSCARVFPPTEHAILRGQLLAHFGVDNEADGLPAAAASFSTRSSGWRVPRSLGLAARSAARRLRAPLRMLVVQRATSRVMTNLDAVVAALRELQAEAVAWCRRGPTADGRGAVTAGDVSSRIAAATISAAGVETSFYVLGALESRALRSRMCSATALGGNPFEFSIAMMEGRTAAEQAALFARTDILIATHGNAEGSAMFMRRGAAIVEVALFQWISDWFRDPALTVFGLSHFPVICTSRDGCLPLGVAEWEAQELIRVSDPWVFLGIVKQRNVTVPIGGLLSAVVSALAAASLPVAGDAATPPGVLMNRLARDPTTVDGGHPGAVTVGAACE